MGNGAPGSSSVALVTCADYPDGYFDDVAVVPPLAALGIAATFAVWDDPAVDWTRFDLAVLRSTWDYAPRRDEFLAWAAGVPTLLNPIDAVRWSSDKRYLHDLAAGGAPCVPTTFVEPGTRPDDIAEAVGRVASSAPRFVVKPSIGAGSIDAGRFESVDPADVGLAIKHTAALVDGGRVAMLQPYLDGIDDVGETALIFLDGEFSHAIRKEPMLAGGVTEFDGLFGDERTSPITPSAAELAAGSAVRNAAPFERGRLLYERIDLLPGPDGEPLLLELELVEPSLFMDDTPGAADRFAAAIAKRCRG